MGRMDDYERQLRREEARRLSRERARRQRLAVFGALAALAVVAVLALVVSCAVRGGGGADSEGVDSSASSVETVPVNSGDDISSSDVADSTSSESGDSTDSPASSEPQNYSTPESEWAQGTMPYLYQTDPQWKDVEYSGGTIEFQGCGPFALSTVYMYLTGDITMGPLAMAEFATNNGYSTDGQGSSWTLMSEGAQMLGLSYGTLSAVPAYLAEQLEAGHPIICVMAPGTFTDVGHFIVLERLDADGKAVVHDSNSVERSNQTWDLELICNEANAIWYYWV